MLFITMKLFANSLLLLFQSGAFSQSFFIVMSWRLMYSLVLVTCLALQCMQTEDYFYGDSFKSNSHLFPRA